MLLKHLTGGFRPTRTFLLVCTSMGLTLGTAGMPASAGLTEAEIARLGQDLTPSGAEKAGNKEGTIPPWEGGQNKPLPGFDPAKGYIDPYADDKPLLTITAANMAEHKDKLAPGQMEMLRRYPTYKIRVFPTRRSYAARPDVWTHAKAEAGQVELAAGGNGILNLKRSQIPFPIPKNGLEVIWNHILRDLGGSAMRHSATLPVQTNGTFTPVTRTTKVLYNASLEKPEPNRLLFFMDQLTGPSNVAGEALAVHEPIDQVKETRLAWLYNPGARRVVRAPDLAYDSPGIGTDGLRTNDDLNGFNGAPDRYNWKLVGKKEMYIGYNNYKLTSKSIKYSDFVKPAHLSPDYLRYELHRVWVVEATLKPGVRHIYAKRVFFIDEDSWAIAHADQYDGRGDLWRVREIFLTTAYDAPVTSGAAEVLYDLQARRYLAESLTNQEKAGKFGLKLTPADFSTDALRRAGQ